MSLNGRPRILDDGKRREICALISAGCGLDAAARYVSCSVSTIRREALRNEHFRKELRGAELRSQLDPLRAMRQAACTHWRAAAWLLERTNPRQFGRHKPDACRTSELQEVIDAIVHQAVDEIPDSKARDRVCRQLLAGAYRASRSIAAAERSRLNPRTGPFDLPTDDPDRRLRDMLEDLEFDRRRAMAALNKKNQNPASFA